MGSASHILRPAPLFSGHEIAFRHKFLQPQFDGAGFAAGEGDDLAEGEGFEIGEEGGDFLGEGVEVFGLGWRAGGLGAAEGAVVDFLADLAEFLTGYS